MNEEKFLLKDRIEQIKKSSIKDGWITIYDNQHDDDTDQSLIYCCLVTEEHFSKYMKDRDWGIRIGSEGRPSVYGDGTYKSFDDDGIEPFIYLKDFTFLDGYDEYIDISEEFILYFKLYEKIESKKNRKYFFITDSGDLDEVISITPNCVKVKQKYLMEYISVRKMYLSICFDFMRFSPTLLCKPLDEDYNSGNLFYNHFIRTLEPKKHQSWIHGKVIIPYNKNRKKGYHFDFENRDYEDYITEYDENGDLVLESCEKNDKNYFTLTYFKKEVLDKYYNSPHIYDVDGFRVRCNFFSLKIDNNLSDFIPVFLVELGRIPHKEQLHWKQYNIEPQKGMSNTYYKTMIEGSWVEQPETIDLFFKQKLESLNEKWKTKFGWELYKPLSKENLHYYNGLHLPTTDNIKSFCHQILGIVIITIDSLNEKELGKGLELKPEVKGITKLDEFLKSKNKGVPEMIEFLRHLQNLRSGLITHRFSKSNKKTKKSLQYFGFKDDNFIEVSKTIFVHSITTLTTLEKIFDLGES